MTERNDHTVIIGGGHNALVCAAYLAKADRAVTVFEAAEQVGGLAVTREFAPGFRVSAAAHLLYLLDGGGAHLKFDRGKDRHMWADDPRSYCIKDRLASINLITKSGGVALPRNHISAS